MRYCILGLIGFFFICCFASAHALAQTRGEGWKLYYIDESGDRYYYDRGSVETPQRGIVVLWQKITGPVSEGEEEKTKAQIRLNCRQRTYQILADAEYDRADKKSESGGDHQKETPQKRDLRPDSRLQALFENACSF